MIAFPLVLLSFLTVCVNPDSLPEHALRAILTAQDLRDTKTLLAFMEEADHSIRAQAAYALGSVQDTSSLHQLKSLLNDSHAEVRRAAAFALGQLNYVVDTAQRRAISEALMQRLRSERVPRIQVQNVEATGKIGDLLSLKHMVKWYRGFGQKSLGADVALSLGRFAYRGVTTSEGTSLAVDLLGDPMAKEKWKAAYALMKIGEKSSLSEHVGSVVDASRKTDSETRMYLAVALGRVADTRRTLQPLIRLTGSDQNWRVRVNALRSLSRFDKGAYLTILPVLLNAVSDPDEHVSLVALHTLGEMELESSEFAEAVRKMLGGVIQRDNTYSPRQKRAAAINLAKVFKLDGYQILADKFRHGVLAADAYVEALGYVPTPEAVTNLFQLAREDELRLKRLSIEAIRRSFNLALPDSLAMREARELFVNGLLTKDDAVATTAAHALADSIFANHASLQALLDFLSRIKSPDDAQLMVTVIQAIASFKSRDTLPVLETKLKDPNRMVALEAAKAIGDITGRQYQDAGSTHTKPEYTNFDWELLDWTRDHPVVEVQTDRGNIRFRMLPEEAPFTCMNFAMLIRKGFYDGLTFHRVVPNFVIQGGDPRGDGWGGPGYAIRSEFSYELYTRGTVGVASAGKDTEGCQFFITHSPQPHLDGRYTVFGAVISGLDVVDRIQIGDKINRMLFVGQ